MQALEPVILAIRAKDIEKAVDLYKEMRPDLTKAECEAVIREWLQKPQKKVRVTKMRLGH